MPLILFLNLKGGVAKTTNAIAIAESLASRGKRTLFIDADHQCMASELLLGDERLIQAEDQKLTLHDLMASMLRDDFHSDEISRFRHSKASSILNLQPKIDCIPCSHRIDEFTTNMARARRGYQSHQEFLQSLNRLRKKFNRWCNRQYDYTVVDCPPSFSVQVLFLLGCAEYYISPSIPDNLSVRGTLYLVERLRKRGYRSIHGLGTAWSMVRKQVKQHLEIIEACANGESRFAALPRPFATAIPNMAAIADSANFSKSYPNFPSKYRGDAAPVFQNLCTEIVERIEEQP